jgi:hypothetical protein
MADASGCTTCALSPLRFTDETTEATVRLRIPRAQEEAGESGLVTRPARGPGCMDDN